jgi:hypothetical protein
MSFIIGLAALTLGHCLHTTQATPQQPTHIQQPATAAPRNSFDENAGDEQRITALAAAIWVAGAAYDEARRTGNPAAALDTIADALPAAMPHAFKTMGTAPDVAAVMLPAVTDRVWAYTAIEHSRIEAGDGYGYLFDFLADKLRAGVDPHSVRTAALGVPARLRALAEQAGDNQ